MSDIGFEGAMLEHGHGGEFPRRVRGLGARQGLFRRAAAETDSMEDGGGIGGRGLLQHSPRWRCIGTGARIAIIGEIEGRTRGYTKASQLFADETRTLSGSSRARLKVEVERASKAAVSMLDISLQ